MQVKEIMTKHPKYLDSKVTIREVANAMRDNDSGFVPLSDGSKVTGVVTDRDIAVRAVAEGKGPDEKASSIATDKVLYTFEDETIENVIENMSEQQVQRLLVLNNADDKDLIGIVTLGDIADNCNDEALAKKVVATARHYH